MNESEWILNNKRLDWEAERKLEKYYEDTYKKLTKSINDWWQTYSKENSMSVADAMKSVNKFDVEYMERAIEKAGNIKNLSAQDKAKLDAYNATMKINQLELLRAQLGVDIIEVFNDGVAPEFVDNLTQNSINQFERMASILGENTFYNHRILQDLATDQKYFGATWGERLSKYGDALISDVHDTVYQALINGRHPKDYYKRIEDYVNMSRKAAQNLLTTYASLVQGQAQLQSYKKYGYDEAEYIAETDTRTCPVCKDLNGKIIKVAKANPGVNWYPMHNRCRCSSAAHYDGEVKPSFTNKVTKNMSRPQKEKLEGYFTGTDPKVQQALQRVWKKNKIKNDPSSFYAPNSKTISVDFKNDHPSEGSEYLHTFFHESGHAIDSELNRGGYLSGSSKAKKFQSALSREMTDLISKNKKRSIIRKYPKTQVRNVSDMWSAYTKDDDRLWRYGHRKAYWSQGAEYKYNEAFAEMFQAMVQGDDQIYLDLLPNAYEEFKKLLMTTLGGKKWTSG